MAHQQLDRVHIGAALRQVRREGMPQRMRRSGFLDATTLTRELACLGHCMAGEGPPGDMALPRPPPSYSNAIASATAPVGTFPLETTR